MAANTSCNVLDISHGSMTFSKKLAYYGEKSPRNVDTIGNSFSSRVRSEVTSNCSLTTVFKGEKGVKRKQGNNVV